MKAMKATIFIPLLLILFALPASAASMKIPLRKLAPVQDYKLRGTMDSYNIAIPIPQRWKVNGATLHFTYVNSSALVPRNSRLVLMVKDQPLAQVRLNPAAPEGEVTVTIPGSLLQEGYATCSFWVSQHYTEEHCEDPFAPELWTWVKLSEAYFVFDVDPIPLPRRVSAITDFLFDPRNIFDTRVNLVIPELSPSYLAAASLAASGIALRYEYRMPDFFLSTSLQAGMDNVLLAARKDLPAFVRDAATLSEAATIAVQHLPEKKTAGGGSSIAENPLQALIVLTGKDEAEVLTAARAFASLSYPLPDSPVARIAALKLPEVKDHMMTRGLAANKAYLFSSLGIRTTEFRSIAPPALHADLRLPSDLYLSPNKFASLVLHMAYDAAMRSDSVLNFRLNGKFISGVRLDNPRGDQFQAYKLEIPLSSFKPGINRLSFEAVLTPLHTDKCTLIQTENLRLTIFDDSKFILPDVPFWTKMPQLDIFFQDAFPLGRWPDLRESAVLLSEKNLSAAHAALNVVALCAQKIGYPPFGLTWILGPDAEKPSKDLLIAGSLGSLPQSLLAKAPIAGIDPIRLTFQNLDRPQPRTDEPVQFWSKVAAFQPEIPRNMEDIRAPEAVVADLHGSIGPGRAVLMQLQHPDAAERSIIVLTASTPEDLIAGSKALWHPAVQSACRGDLSLINLERPEFETLAHLIGPSYYLGNPGRLPIVQNFINTHPLLSLIALLLLLLFLCTLLLGLVKKRRRRRLEPSRG